VARVRDDFHVGMFIFAGLTAVDVRADQRDVRPDADAIVVSRRKDVDCSFTVAILVGVMHCLLKDLRITFSLSCGLVGLTSGTEPEPSLNRACR
jgi:hypothetical protein